MANDLAYNSYAAVKEFAETTYSKELACYVEIIKSKGRSSSKVFFNDIVEITIDNQLLWFIIKCRSFFLHLEKRTSFNSNQIICSCEKNTLTFSTDSNTKITITKKDR